MDYYQILGLTKTADMETIKKAYRRLAKECHPDAYPGDQKAEERFKQITEAYAVLSDVEKRKEYDRERADADRKRKAASGTKTSKQPFGPEDFGGGFADFFSFMNAQPKGSQDSQEQKAETKKQETKRNPIDTSGLFEWYMGFK